MVWELPARGAVKEPHRAPFCRTYVVVNDIFKNNGVRLTSELTLGLTSGSDPDRTQLDAIGV